jgi:hypothetical protein
MNRHSNKPPALAVGFMTCYWYITVFPLLDPAYPCATSTPGMLKACGRVVLSTASGRRPRSPQRTASWQR